MKIKVSPSIVGLFVLGAVVLGVVALLSFGGVNFFTKPQRFVVYFDESIHGLDRGSPVKLRGVRVGRVIELNVRYNAQTNQSLVAVICEFESNRIIDQHGQYVDVKTSEELQKFVDRGLRAQLGFLGFATGLLFVELDFMNVDEYPAPTEPKNPLYVVVPAVPSTIAASLASVNEILSDLKRVDFAGLSREVRGMIVDVRKQLNTLDLAALSTELTKTSQAVAALANSPDIPKTFANLNKAIDQFTVTLANVDTQVGPAGVKLNDALTQAKDVLKTIDSAAASARNFVNAQSGVGEETMRTLTQLGDAAAAIQRLADFIERNPNALLTGKKAPK